MIESFELEGTPRGHLVQPPPQRAGTPLTRSGCSEPCPTWSWMFPGFFWGNIERRSMAPKKR